MSKANVIKKLNKIAGQLNRPVVCEHDQEYEIDEMQTFVKMKSNHCYIIYTLNKRSRRVIDFTVGARTNENISKVVDSPKSLKPMQIFTDCLNVYPSLIDKNLHTASAHQINHLERFNLTLRTHLKRLARKTICFSKSQAMLENCLCIYLWNWCA